MARKPKTTRVPRTRAGGEWTEAAFWNFLHSGIRLMSRRWPPLYQAMRAARRKHEGPDKRRKWEYQCAICGEWFDAKSVHVDHIVPVGRLRSWDDVGPAMQRLFCEADGLRVACKACNYARKGGGG